MGRNDTTSRELSQLVEGIYCALFALFPVHILFEISYPHTFRVTRKAGRALGRTVPRS